MTNTGKGIATVFRDGKAFPGTWSRKAGEIFHLFNESQEEIPLKPGKASSKLLVLRSNSHFLLRVKTTEFDFLLPKEHIAKNH